MNDGGEGTGDGGGSEGGEGEVSLELPSGETQADYGKIWEGGLLAAVDEVNKAEADKATEATEKPDEEKPEKPGEKGKKTRREFEAFLMSDAELAKPEGVKKAAEYWQRQAKKHHSIDARHMKRGAELEAGREELRTHRAAFEQEMAPARATAARLVELERRLTQSDNWADRLDAIGEITGRKGAGREVWDNLAQFALNWVKSGGKPAPQQQNREVLELRETVQRLEQRLAALPDENKKQAEEEEKKRLAPEVQRLEQQTIKLAMDAEKYPTLATYALAKAMHSSIIDNVRAIRRKAKESGEPIDVPAALGIIDTKLQKRLAGMRKPASHAGAKPAPSASVTPASPVAVKTTSIAPSQSRLGATVREKTEAELESDLARDTSFLSSTLGFQL